MLATCGGMTMALTDLGARRIAQTAEPVPTDFEPSAGIEALEAEIRAMRAEFLRLRDMIVEREQKGRTLINAYRDVIAELTNLFEAERKENVKREESLRFFLASIEKRLKEDIRNELGGGGEPSEGNGRRRRGIWPFRRR